MEKIVERIKKIRKLKYRSVHDCAKVLNIPKERYHHFEEGNGVLSLPELELLAIFLEVPLQSFFQDSDLELDKAALLSEEKMPIYKNLRDKIIRTKLNLEIENNGISVENLSDNTGISLQTLKSYQENGESIPFDHLTRITELLGIPINSLLQDTIESDEEFVVEKVQEQTQWQPEYQDGREIPVEEETPQTVLLEAVKSLSMTGQAEIAKLLLEKLKAA
ncbi:MAG: helix-turn-helix transcriptional regulator [Brevefilum sp.]|nr:helix-turn-helix transcriptional regulator [Brevefilum sp.]MDW7755885.1 helix-turn-helix transcriptional regulator [Brevefilum sp.]